ncbi:magnesium transporter NIPA-domain-containing protein [Dichotomocladium elegans]|nr:magnesium transporter NIPA-domain-containing protein [Dichotomocladium elegans]
MLTSARIVTRNVPEDEADPLIGVVLSICGNVLISFALNIQKLAHNQLSLSESRDNDPEARNAGPRPPSFSSSSSQPLYSDALSKGKMVSPNDSDSDDTSYLRSKVWWLGIILMVVGEVGNFMAYGFAPASTIAPLGTTTMVSNAILAPLLLEETFRKQDFIGIVFAMLGAAGVVSSSKSIEYKLSPELVAAALMQTRSLIFYVVTFSMIAAFTVLSPKYGTKNILIDLGLVALYGAYTVVATKGLSSLLNLTLYNLFTYGISYVLMAILVVTAIMQVKYLNRAMQRYDSTAVIPTQFVLFTISAIIGSAVIYRDFDGDDPSHLNIFIFGCLTEFLGIFLITSGRGIATSSEAAYESLRRAKYCNDANTSLAGEHAKPLASNAIRIGTGVSSSICSQEDHEPTETMPLLQAQSRATNDEEHHQRSVSSQRSAKPVGSIFRGISLHSQLAGGKMIEDDRATIETSLSNDIHQ